jgi:hypothetical protein
MCKRSLDSPSGAEGTGNHKPVAIDAMYTAMYNALKEIL